MLCKASLLQGTTFHTINPLRFYGMVQIVKAVQYDLVSIPKVSSQTIQHRFIRVQNSKISLGKHYIALFHRVSLPVSWIKSVFSIP